MLTLSYFQFFGSREAEELDHTIQYNYTQTIDSEHFYAGDSYVPDVRDVVFDRRRGTMRTNVSQLIYNTVVSQVHAHHPESIQLTNGSGDANRMVYQDAYEHACRTQYKNILRDVTTLLYMRSMTFREGAVMCNPTLIEVW